ncbi:MAG: hypothetical protein ABI472_23420 [Ginsengibacter sp.]
MENSYSAYVRTVNGDTFYFVKKYQVFTEYKDLPPLLDSYAMHTDFNKACKIALISGKAAQQLMNDLQINQAPSRIAKQTGKATIYKLKPRQINLPAIFRLGWLTKI